MSNTHYILIESLENTYHAGGVVMLPILLVGVIGFYYLFTSWFRIGRDFFRKDIHRVIKRMRLDLNGGIEEDEKNGEAPSPEKALRRLRKRGGLLSRELCYASAMLSKSPVIIRRDFATTCRCVLRRRCVTWNAATTWYP